MTDLVHPKMYPVYLLLCLVCFGCLWITTSDGQAMLQRVDAALAQAPTYDHAVDRHGLNAVEPIRKCIDNGGTWEAWYNPNTKRSALVCKPLNTFAVQIAKFVHGRKSEITSFPKEAMRRLEQVQQYLRNRGYGKVGTPEFNMWLDSHPEHKPFLPPVP